MIFMLAFFVSLMPLSPVFAQEVAESSAPTEHSNVSDNTQASSLVGPVNSPSVSALPTVPSNSPSPSVNNSSTQKGSDITNNSPKISPEPSESDEANPQDDVTASQNTMTANSLSPQDQTRDNSRDVVDAQHISSENLTGSLHYEYPIIVPPGRNNLTPDLKLEYSSQPNENISPYGYGWSDNIPYIERINKKGSDTLYSENYYYSSFDGELKANDSASTTTSYGAKVDNGNFLTYTYTSNNKWLVTDKTGTTYKFGYSTSTQQYDQNNPSHIFKWMLEEVRDTNGNYISYQYFHDAGQLYPSKIIYTGNGITDGNLEIDFLRELRSDIATSSKAAFPITSKYRINEIQTKVNNTWVKKYDLSYTTSANGRRSLLSSLTESGQDESSSVKTLPATTFTYQSDSNSKGWDYGGVSSAIPEPFVLGPSLGFSDNGVHMLDVNGDGLSDVVIARNVSGTGYGKVYVKIPSGWNLVNWTSPQAFIDTPSYRTRGVQLADVNGDGLVDVIYHPYASGSNATYLNTGNGWSADNATWHTPVHSLYDPSIPNEENGVRIVDVNGDGLADILYARVNLGNSTTTEAYINNGAGWTLNSTWNSPELFINSDNSDRGVRLADVNGDGLVDILVSQQTTSGANGGKVYINNGAGWTLDPSWTYPNDVGFVSSSDKGDRGVRLADINGDGLPDLVFANNNYLASPLTYINNGAGWTLDYDWRVRYGSPTFTDSEYRDQGVRLVDYDGDGMDDLVWAAGDTNVAYLNKTKRVDLLSTITSNKGSLSTIVYKASGLYSTSTSAYLNPYLPQNYDTVAQVGINDGLGHNATTTYVYEGGTYYYNGAYDRYPGGFHTITKTDPASTTVKTFYHQGNDTDSTHGESADSWAKIGKPYRIEIADSSGNVYNKTVNQWATSTLSNGREFVKLARKTDLAYDGNSDHKDTSEEYTYDVASGNLTQKKQWGEVTGSDNGTFTDTGTDDFTTTITYASTTGSAVHGLPSDETLLDHSSTKIAETRHYYDTLTLGNVGAGNETKTEKWKTGSTYINNQKTYNGYGLVTQDTDPRGKNTTYTYDTYNLYVATSTNPLSQTTAYVYDYSLGKPKQITDTNGRVFQTVYDGLDRIKEEKQPDITTPSTLVTKSMYVYTDSGIPTNVEKIDYLNSASTTSSYSYFDGLGRTIQERKQAEAANTYAVKDTVYNSLGLKQKESLPYFATGASSTSATSTDALYTRYVYDPLQRPLTVANAVGTTTYSYDNWMTHIQDPRFKTKNLYQDAYNNLIKVDEILGATGYNTQYNYNGIGNLTKITDAMGNVRNFTYDGLGRRTKAEDLHASTDATFGSTTFAYDDTGNLTQKIDAKNQTVNYTFDNINRPLTEDYTGQAGTEITYGYDSCPNGKGRLCSATTTASVSNYEYNALGLQSKETKTLNSVNYVTSTSYDRQGNIINLVYPDNSQVNYFYNNAGLIEYVNRKETTDTDPHDVIRNFDYSPLGQVATTTDGTNMTTVNTYDPNQLYRLTKKETVYSGVPAFQDIAYAYDANGNITQIIDNSDTATAKNALYTYDDLNRLTQAQVTATSSGSWYNSSWRLRIPVTASSTKVLEDTKDVYLDLSLLPSLFFSNAKSNGCDIRVTKADGSTELPIDLASFGANSGQLYFSTGNSLSATTSTTFYLYYGNASASCYAATSTYGAQNVYDSNTKGVWHLEQNSATTGGIIDSTSNAHNGTMYSNFVAHANGTTAGKLGSGAVFDGIDDTIDVPDSSDFEGNAMTLEGWVNMSTYPSAKGENETIFTKKHTASPWTSYALYISSPANRTDGKWTDSAGVTTYAGTYAGTTTTNTWHYVVLRHNPASTTSELSVRTDGSSANTYTADTTGTTFNSDDVLRFGADWASGDRLQGDLDEIRVHNQAVSDNYITTRFNNMNSPSTFWSIGSISSDPHTASYTENYTYNILGNIITKTGQGAYTYAGTTTGSYANPHAVTKIGTSNYTYDNNGNLLTSPGITNTWDYRNRLTQTVASSTVTYAYDQADNRVKYSDASTTIYYANNYYNTSSATTTKQIYANNQPIATLTGTGASTTLQYILTDQIGGTSVMTTSAHPVPVETIDYYPYGTIRVDTGDVDFLNEPKKFAGATYDAATQYNYMGARYQNPNIGRFISQDPAFLAVGNPSDLKSKTGLDLQTYLSDPQGLNSYSYARNNPIKLTDPMGAWFGEFLTGQQSWSSFQLELGQAANQLSLDSAVWNAAINHPIAAGATIGIGSGLATYGASAGITALNTQYLGGLGTGCVMFCDKAQTSVQQGVNMLEKTSSLWPGPEKGQQVINGIRYSEHALARMIPNGMSYVDKAGQVIEGRGIPPSVIENAIKYGTKVGSYDGAVVRTYENVRVITNTAGDFVRTVIKIGK